jgi:Zn-dependent protease/CBS domain-containing protein
MARDSFTVFRVGRVPIRIHITWLLVAAYLWYLFAAQFGQLARAAEVGETKLLLPAWLWGIVLTLAFFSCVVLHELAHVAVALRGGAKVRAITLMMLGGVSEVSEVRRPRLERWMAAAGPAASLLLGGLFWLLYLASRHGPADVRFGLFYLAQLNFVIGVFNLLPAFPMDGGRILRSLLEPSYGRVRATQIAATVGKLFAVALAIFGVLGGGLWLVLIGMFVFFAGDAESRAVTAKASLRGLHVRDFYQRRLAAVPRDATLADAAHAMIAERTNTCVIADGGVPVGMVGARAVRRLPVRERALHRVNEVSQPVRTVTVDDDLGHALGLLEEERVDAVLVADGGHPVGTLGLDDILRAIELRELSPARV